MVMSAMVQIYAYFHEMKDGIFYSTRRSQVEYNIYISRNENICRPTIAGMKNIDYLFYKTSFLL